MSQCSFLTQRREVFSALVIVWDVFHNVPNLAAEDFAEHFDGVGADALISFQPGDLSGADVVLLDKGVLGDTLSVMVITKERRNIN